MPNCQRAALVQVGDLTTYDAVKQLLRRRFGVADGPLLHAACSAAAGLVAATLGAPADVIKTRVMNQVAPIRVSLLHSLAQHSGLLPLSPPLCAIPHGNGPYVTLPVVWLSTS